MSGKRQRNGRLGLVLAGVVFGMVGLSFAAVPFYRLFCRVTGFAGTTQRADAAPAETGDRTITVYLNGDTNAGIPWEFRPMQRSVKLRVGEQALVSYRAHNYANETVVGTATFNVTPETAGIYFYKVQCFCFTQQTLKPGESVDMPVVFYVDPAFAKDKTMDGVRTITLSYTFFRAVGDGERRPGSPAPARAPAAGG